MDPNGFDERVLQGGAVVQTCRGTVPDDDLQQQQQEEEQQQFVIYYQYNLTIPEGTDSAAAVIEGEGLIGRGVAQLMCGSVTFSGGDDNDDNPYAFFMKEVNSKLADSIDGICPTTESDMACFQVYGLFTVSLVIRSSSANPPTRRQLRTQSDQGRSKQGERSNPLRRLEGTSSFVLSNELVNQQFQNVLDVVLPNVAQEMTTFQSDFVAPGSIQDGVDEQPRGQAPLQANNDGDTGHTLTITSAIIAGATGLLIVYMVFFFGSRHRRRRQEEEEEEAQADRRIRVLAPTTSAGGALQPMDIIVNHDVDDDDNDDNHTCGTKAGKALSTLSGDSFLEKLRPKKSFSSASRNNHHQRGDHVYGEDEAQERDKGDADVALALDGEQDSLGWLGLDVVTTTCMEDAQSEPTAEGLDHFGSGGGKNSFQEDSLGGGSSPGRHSRSSHRSRRGGLFREWDWKSIMS